MIYLIVGTNEYAIEKKLRELSKKLGVERENIDVAELTRNGLADIMRGATLFAEKRLVVVRQLSEDKDLWNAFSEWANDVPAETTIVLIESKPDKRTKGYKTIARVATMIDATPFTDRQQDKAEEWLERYAKDKNVLLSKKQLSEMISRAMVADENTRTTYIDQMLLTRAVTTLKGEKEITSDVLATVLPPVRAFSVFDILDLAIHGNSEKMQRALFELQQTDSAYMVAPLIWSQWSQIALIVSAREKKEIIELGIHPFVERKLRALSESVSIDEAQKITQYAADCDYKIKTQSVESWNIIWAFLSRVAYRKK